MDAPRNWQGSNSCLTWEDGIGFFFSWLVTGLLCRTLVTSNVAGLATQGISRRTKCGRLDRAALPVGPQEKWRRDDLRRRHVQPKQELAEEPGEEKPGMKIPKSHRLEAHIVHLGFGSATTLSQPWWHPVRSEAAGGSQTKLSWHIGM